MRMNHPKHSMPHHRWAQVLMTFMAIGFFLQNIVPYLLDVLFQQAYPVPTAGAILITGTSTGIGRATCGHLAQKYPNMTFFCGLRKMPDNLRDKNSLPFPFSLPNVKPSLLDITNEDHIQHALRTITAQNHQPLVGVINNAGIHHHGTLEFTSLPKFRQLFEVNVFGTYRLIQTTLPLLRKSHGRIIIVGSITGKLVGVPFTSAYQATKHALEPLADSLRQELLAQRISVSMIEPGMVESEITHRMQQLGQNNGIDRDDDAACLANDNPPNDNETFVYPTLLSKEYTKLTRQAWGYPGDVTDTLEAMEHALFDKYPRPRYITSTLGGMSAAHFACLSNWLPDRVNDWLVLQGLPWVVKFMQARNHVEKQLEKLLPK